VGPALYLLRSSMADTGPAPEAAPAAAEAAKEDAGIPYLGARISLVSNANIRYEGTLYTIDTKEATVALQNVRVLGTEGRTNGGTEVPPSDDVYEFIVFAGKDIKELHVMQDNTPPPAPAPLPPSDPAIMQFSQPSPVSANDPWGPGMMPPPGLAGPPMGFDYSAPFGGPPQGFNNFPPAGGGGAWPEQGYQQQPPQQRANNGPYQGPGTGGFLEHNQRNRKNARPSEPRPEGDFDYSASTARFDKETYLAKLEKVKTGEGEEATELADGEVKEGEEASGETAPAGGDLSELGLDLKQINDLEISTYDPKKSFFDDFNTGTREREDRQREKQTNTETFGSLAQSFRQPNYRNYNKQGGYNNNRGNYQGGGGFGQNNGQGKGGRKGEGQGKGQGQRGGRRRNNNNRNRNQWRNKPDGQSSTGPPNNGAV